MNKRRLIPLFAAFVLWGSQYVISKIALRTVPPVTLLALRYLVFRSRAFHRAAPASCADPREKRRLADSLCHRLYGVFREFLPANAGHQPADRFGLLPAGRDEPHLHSDSGRFLPARAHYARQNCLRGAVDGRRGRHRRRGRHGRRIRRAADARQRLSLVYRFYHHPARQRAIRSRCRSR